ncbi:acyl-CoA synthetase (AMP-forming)/AMP-acid ligase II [Thiovulum sp. ES]|nr:acyl-CoA synthetase (AMP-forming)/AMP-acid ligase II [Thiovulum sp. ES]
MIEIKSNKLFISYKNKKLSFTEFFNEVNKLEEKFDNFKKYDDFILINEENPIYFYPLLFSLWKNNKKVIFPNRDFFSGKNLDFAKYIIKYDEIYQNSDFKSNLEKISEGDTIVFSSGSTGEPKGILNKKDSFFKNAQSVLIELKVSKIVSVTPLKPYLVSAISHFLVHLLSKSHLIFLETQNLKEDVEKNSSIYNELSYVGSPMQIVSMLPFIRNKNPKLFFSSGDLFYPQIISSIFDKFPDSKIFNAYGLAELSGRLFINKISENNFSKIGKNINRTEVKIIDSEVVVSSDLLFSGYIKGSEFIKRTSESFKTGDIVIEVDKELEFYGRLNDEIKVGGNKISLKYIEKKVSNVLTKDFTPILINKEHNLLGNIVILILYY